MKVTLIEDVKPNLYPFTHHIIDYCILFTDLFCILLVQSSSYIGVIGLLLTLMISVAFMNASSGLGNGVIGQGYLNSKNLGHSGLNDQKLGIPPEHSNEFWVDGLRLIKE